MSKQLRFCASKDEFYPYDKRRRTVFRTAAEAIPAMWSIYSKYGEAYIFRLVDNPANSTEQQSIAKAVVDATNRRWIEVSIEGGKYL